MGNEQLQEKLDALQCHFTWDLGVIGHVEPAHVLQKLAVEIKHTPHQNQVALLGLQAYLYQQKGQHRKALQSLEEAEKHLRQDEPDAFSAGSLVICGNYAWIHYLQASYPEAESYLDRIQALYPAPWDAVMIQYIQAQKGWSLLAVRGRNGERARECFQLALMLEPGNKHFHAGLGMAFFASWIYSWYPDFAKKAIIQLERTVLEQPDNYRAKISLARLLESRDEERSTGLIEESAEKSSDPEVLKSVALLWLPQSAERSIEILQRALQLDPYYHLLYQALAKCYKKQWLNAEKENKEKMLEAGIKALEEVLQKCPDLALVHIKLKLAELYGERDPSQEEQIYKELQRREDTLSLRHRQALCLHWGKFLLYKKKARQAAIEKFKDGYRIPLLTGERQECMQKLKQLSWPTQNSEGYAIYRFIQETDQQGLVEVARIDAD
ncbi:interferon-induced protein with tetratricopeptide repeats 2-like [Dromaius novaehollandiae]|uniref:interferon-induced protein with tetratricopeptide repeats 2-like n=1 Tax=Dromaius novaehollandiae TaxID=8790 RepID=UPI00311F240A